jgi:hypothetical protein
MCEPAVWTLSEPDKDGHKTNDQGERWIRLPLQRGEILAEVRYVATSAAMEYPFML